MVFHSVIKFLLTTMLHIISPEPYRRKPTNVRCKKTSSNPERFEWTKIIFPLRNKSLVV